MVSYAYSARIADDTTNDGNQSDIFGGTVSGQNDFHTPILSYVWGKMKIFGGTCTPSTLLPLTTPVIAASGHSNQDTEPFTT